MAVRGNYHFFNPMNEADDEVGWTSLAASQALFPLKTLKMVRLTGILLMTQPLIK